VDKTGTLTLNRMTVTKVAVADEVFDVERSTATLPERLHQVVEFSLLASPADPFDPMEKAMRDLGARALAATEHLHVDWTLLREYPLSPELLAMSRVWQSPDGRDYVIAAKGAPEAIADLCHMGVAQRQALADQIDRVANFGLRVIGVARSQFRPADLPDSQHDFTFEYLGLLGLTDPVRPGVPEAVRDCHAAGIRVLMITGDYPATARNIAEKIGLRPADQVITGPELEAMSEAELRQRLRTTCIFARAVPEHKLRIVQALKANGEVVAMTGDGVNDAPALKAAHIGLAVGGRGTDVAREAAALVLLDDNFASIVAAVRMGRRIFDNLKKALGFIFAVHIPIAGLSLLPVLLGWPLALLPVHIVFLELIIDPACTLVFEMEAEEAGLMQRPPRRLSEPLFGPGMLLAGLVQGMGILLAVTATYGWVLAQGWGEAEARMIGFSGLVLADLGLILANRSRTRSILQTLRSPNPALGWISAGTLGILALALFVPAARDLFSFAPLHPGEIGLILGTGLVGLLAAESVKTGVWQHLTRALGG
jgi:Ca2+-transporting ATPase